ASRAASHRPRTGTGTDVPVTPSRTRAHPSAHRTHEKPTPLLELSHARKPGGTADRAGDPGPLDVSGAPFFREQGAEGAGGGASGLLSSATAGGTRPGDV